MNKLRNKLLSANQNNEICIKLRDLNHLILKSKLEILLNDKRIATIYPLWVEAYYYNKKQNWCDQAIHGNGGVDEQKDNELTLYFHRKGKGGGYEGVDLVLSNDKNYALAFLLKNCVLEVNGTKDNYSEKELDKKLNEIVKRINSKSSLRFNKNACRTILKVKMFDIGINQDLCFFETIRVGIKCNNKIWKDYELASFIMRKDFYKTKYKSIFAKNSKKYF